MNKNVTHKQRKKGKQDLMRNNQYLINQDINKKEFLAKNRRYKDSSFEVPPNWNCIY